MFFYGLVHMGKDDYKVFLRVFGNLRFLRDNALKVKERNNMRLERL